MLRVAQRSPSAAALLHSPSGGGGDAVGGRWLPRRENHHIVKTDCPSQPRPPALSKLAALALQGQGTGLHVSRPAQQEEGGRP